MRELTTTELQEVSGGVQFGLDYDQGAALQLGLVGIALTIGAPITAGFAFGAAIMLSVVSYASNRAGEQNGTGGTSGASGSSATGGATRNATGGSRIPQSEES